MISENLWQPWIYNCQIFGLLLAMILFACAIVLLVFVTT